MPILLNIYLIFTVISFISPLQVVSLEKQGVKKIFETMVIMNFKIKGNVMFMKLENIYSDLSFEILRVHFFHFFFFFFWCVCVCALPNKAFLRQANDIVLWEHACQFCHVKICHLKYLSRLLCIFSEDKETILHFQLLLLLLDE